MQPTTEYIPVELAEAGSGRMEKMVEFFQLANRT